jgi:X-Pro dipeptidyl-peptidase
MFKIFLLEIRLTALVQTYTWLAIGTTLPWFSFAASGSSDRPWIVENQTIPYFKMTQAISEVIFIETGFDRDQNGVMDTIRVSLSRPDASAKVPLIIHASPYIRRPKDFWEIEFFVPRGYAVASVSLPGTHLSTGCADVGGEFEVLGTKAVIDWANGRAEGHYEDGSVADATQWSNGNTAMIGVSWDGTIANSVAATGVEGLKTIVPVAAISSWYDYTRGNGIPYFKDHVTFLNNFVSNYLSKFCKDMTPTLQSNSDDSTGSYNNWWSARDYSLDASKLKASVFLVHGLVDENVKTRQFGKWWDELVKNGVERRLFLHQSAHIDPYSFGKLYTDPLQKWFDYYLQGLDNGVLSDPQAIIQREDGSWSTDNLWPPVDTTNYRLKMSAPADQPYGALTTFETDLGDDERFLSFTQAESSSDDSIVRDPAVPRGDRLVFLSSLLRRPVRQSGAATISLRLKVDRPAAGFQLRVVDYQNSSAYIVSRTVADLGHHKSLYTRENLVPGQWYTLTWEINTDDRIFAAEHNIGLVISAEKPNPLVAYEPVTATMDTHESWISMPLSGNVSDLGTVDRSLSGRLRTTQLGPLEPTRDAHEFVREFFEGSK